MLLFQYLRPCDYRPLCGAVEHKNRFSYSMEDYMVNLTIELKIMITAGHYLHRPFSHTC